MRVKSENKFKPQFERNSYSLESESENSQPEIRVKPNKLKTYIPFVLYSHNPLDHTSIVQPSGVPRYHFLRGTELHHTSILRLRTHNPTKNF